jgi:serine/threonine-protein kinase
VLVDHIGTGSMGAVYKAIGKADRQPYALKVLPSHGPWNIGLARRRLAALPAEPHPVVIPFIDVGTSAGRNYLVWPFVPGETLESLVRRNGILPPAQAARIGWQIAQALQFCERHCVFHGLVKPSNILIAADGQTHLLDFGVGPMLADAESNESLIDTLSESNLALSMLDCLSPEALVDPGRRSTRGDQYSLGCSLYYALSGRYPFSDGSAIEKMVSHQSAEPTPIASLNQGVPPAMVRIIDRLLQKAPELRYNNIADLIEALYELARQSTVYMPPDMLTPPSVPLRGPTTTPVRSAPTLLSAVTPRVVSGPPSLSVEITPPPRPRPPLMPLPPPPKAQETPPSTGFLRRLGQSILFWKPRDDSLTCTLLSPTSALPGESVALQVVIHDSARSAHAQSLPEWRGSQALSTRVPRGAALDLHAALQDISLSRPLEQVLWAGASTATVFNVRVPETWPLGTPMTGVVTVNLDEQMAARVEFFVPIGAPASMS